MKSGDGVPAGSTALQIGRLRFVTDDTAPTNRKPPAVKPAPIQDLTAKEKRVLQRRWSALEPLTLLGHVPQEIDYTSRAEELHGEGENLSARTLHRYYQAWLRAGKDRMALAPRVKRPGQSRGARKTSLLKKYPQIRKLVDEAIQAIYLTKARRPISAVTRRVLEDLQRLNSRLPAAPAVPVPRQSALDRAIGRRIARLDPWEVDTQRWGRKIADRRQAPTSPWPTPAGYKRMSIPSAPAHSWTSWPCSCGSPRRSCST
jgi:putative transposase